jgi:hypothetical protein
MKSITKVVLIAALVVVPIASFAQSIQSVSRAEVRDQLVQLEKAGYDPHDWIHYPENLQAAEKKVAAQNAVAQGTVSSYGGNADGNSNSGRAGGL